VATQEAGKAIMGLLMPDFDSVTKVTIIPRTNGAGGFTLFTKSEEQLESGMYSKKYLCAQLAVALGGRVAEEIVYGKDEITTGASNDLQQVRNIARRMVAQWGYAKGTGSLGDGPVAWEAESGNNPLAARVASEETEQAIDDQVKLLVNSAYKTAYDLLSANRPFLDAIVEKLLEKETLDFNELGELRNEFGAKPQAVVA
jgi:cell division protease FtsH